MHLLTASNKRGKLSERSENTTVLMPFFSGAIIDKALEIIRSVQVSYPRCSVPLHWTAVAKENGAQNTLKSTVTTVPLMLR